MPKLLKIIMKRVKQENREKMILFLLIIALLGLVPMCHYAGSSHLLGAFLTGLMFCTDHTIENAFKKQLKRLVQWSLRLFFSCTIGFQVPIKSFWSGKVIGSALFYMIAILGKFLTGIFAKPLNLESFLTVGLSMSAWGEFAFILATTSYQEGFLDNESFSSTLFAVLLSVLIPPYLLKLTVNYFRKEKQKIIDKTKNSDELHPVFYCINTKGRGIFGHQDILLKTIFELKLELIDFRVNHDSLYDDTQHLPYVNDMFYVLDNKIKLKPTKFIDDKDKVILKERCIEIKNAILNGMNNNKLRVNIMRWLPGLKKSDDNKDIKNNKEISYCKQEAYKEANKQLIKHEIKRSMSNTNLIRGSMANLLQRTKSQNSSFYGWNNVTTPRGVFVGSDDELVSVNVLESLNKIHDTLIALKTKSDSSDDTELTETQKKSIQQAGDEVNKLIKRMSERNVLSPMAGNSNITPLSKKVNSFRFPMSKQVSINEHENEDESDDSLNTDDEFDASREKNVDEIKYVYAVDDDNVDNNDNNTTKEANENEADGDDADDDNDTVKINEDSLSETDDDDDDKKDDTTMIDINSDGGIDTEQKPLKG